MRGGFATFGFCVIGSHRLAYVVCSVLLLCCVCLTGCSEEVRSSPKTSDSLPDGTPERLPVLEGDAPDAPRRYEGLTLDEWRERIKLLGPGVAGAEEAVPGLRAIAEDRTVEPALRRQAVTKLGRLGKPGLKALPTLQKLLREPADDHAIPAVWSAKAIGFLGPAASAAVPRMIEVLEDPATPIEAQLACLEALARMGGHHPQAIPAVVRTLNRSIEGESESSDRQLLMGAVESIAIVGPGASFAVPRLLSLLNHPHELVRLKVVQALRAIGTPASPAAAPLAEMLVFDDSDGVRREAAFALAAIGPEGHTLLLNLTRDEEISVRTYSTEGIGAISPRTQEVETRLRETLRDDAASVELAAAVALQQAPSDRAEVLQVFARLIADRDRSIRLRAANQLTAMQPDDVEWERLRLEVHDRLEGESLRLWERIESMRDDRR